MLNNSESILTDIFDGLQLEIDPAEVETSSLSYEKSGWVTGAGTMRVTPTVQKVYNYHGNII